MNIETDPIPILSSANIWIWVESLTSIPETGVNIAITGGVVSLYDVGSLLTVTAIGCKLIKLPARSVILTLMKCSLSSA